MGCDSYSIVSTDGKQIFDLQFSNNDPSVGCLCTFPGKDAILGTLTADRVRSLAYLGAAMVLAKENTLDHPMLPDCIPAWIREWIDHNTIDRPVRTPYVY